MMEYRKIVIATDKFKGSLTSDEAAEAIQEGISEAFRNTQRECPEIRNFPMADGGEGSLVTMKSAMESSGSEYREVSIPAVNQLGHPVQVPVLLLENNTAFIEMAAACGLNLVPHDSRDLLHSTTYGFGETIRIAIETYGARDIMLSIGGSGTNDGGFGLLTALGYRFSNSNPFRNKDIPTFLEGIESMMDEGVDMLCPHLKDTVFKVACDVSNPLLGPDGASAVYGPQKGATPEIVGRFEKALENWADVVEKWSGADEDDSLFNRYSEGAGAAGGTGFILGSVLKAEMMRGWEFFSGILNLDKHIAEADLVITGEGRFDRSSLSGKLPWGIATLCRKHRKPVWVVTGRNCLPKEIWRPSGFNEVLSIETTFRSESNIFNRAAELLTKMLSDKFSSIL